MWEKCKSIFNKAWEAIKNAVAWCLVKIIGGLKWLLEKVKGS